MPRKLRRLSGPEVIAILERFGFEVVSQRGSHIKLRRTLPDGQRQTLHLPNHRELDSGTCRAIFRQASEHIAEAELATHFFSE